jgi:membrane-associated phospholipid phosphatase
VTRVRATLVTALILAAMLAACALWPKIDLGLAHSIYEAQGGGFGARRDTALIWLRDLGIYLPIGILGLAFLWWLIGLLRRDPRPALRNRGMLFLAASFALGPGLLVNGVLKDISHRPRPVQLAEFGGQDAFRPWYAFEGACKSNCSFASGEVAGAAWLLAPASLAPPPWEGPAIAAAGAFTLMVAALRMAFGGHFASDVIAAALITLASMLAVAWLVRRARAKDDFGDKRRTISGTS